MKHSIRLILLGAPGAGKGTQAEKIAAAAQIPAISTGAIIREAIAAGTEMGALAKSYIERGALVPDEVVIGIIRDRLTADDCKNGFILDGFPRTVPQAELLEKALEELGTKLDCVVCFDVPDEELIKRLTARMNCRGCDEIYNKIFKKPAREGICDKCGSELYQRADDSLETAQSRLAVFHKQTQPLMDYYTRRGLVFTLPNADHETIMAAIAKELE